MGTSGTLALAVKCINCYDASASVTLVPIKIKYLISFFVGIGTSETLALAVKCINCYDASASVTLVPIKIK